MATKPGEKPSAQFEEHLQQRGTTLATLWKIERRDGVKYFYTDHNEPISFNGDLYVPQSGIKASTVTTEATGGVSSLDVEGHIEDDEISDKDILNGLFRDASLEIMLVNYENVSAGVMYLLTGNLGQFTVSGNGWSAEFRGLTHRLKTSFGQNYSRTCRANFTDGTCKVDPSTVTYSGSVTGVQDSLNFSTDVTGFDFNTFEYGFVEWTSGNNTGARYEIKRSDSVGNIQLYLPVLFPVSSGDTFTIREGCDKEFSTCKNRFGNAINFQGEPDVPGLEFLLAPARRQN
jgi:uncharacterized phage protein (TIGR02218 family)